MSVRSIVRHPNCLTKTLGIRCFSNNFILNNKDDNKKKIPNNNNEKYNKHVKYLTKFYDPEIVESILLAESVIKPEHYQKTRYNNLEFAPSYIDDFINLDPYFDHSKDKKKSHLQFLETVPIAQENESDFNQTLKNYDENVETIDNNYLQQYEKVDLNLNQLNILKNLKLSSSSGLSDTEIENQLEKFGPENNLNDLFEGKFENPLFDDINEEIEDISLEDLRSLQEDNTIYDKDEILDPKLLKYLENKKENNDNQQSQSQSDLEILLNDLKTNKQNISLTTNSNKEIEDEESYFEDLQAESDAIENEENDLENEKDNDDENSESLKKLCQLTGFDADYISDLRKINLLVKFVSNQTGNGKIPSFFAMVCVGDGQGMLGLGEGKDPSSVELAINKAYWQAVKNLKKIPLLENRTIFGEVEFKFGASIVQLRTAPPGYGLRVNHHIFKLAQVAGIKDLSGKVYKSRNPMNVLKAATEALQKQKTTNDIALERGKKVIDLKRIYYSG